MISQSLDSFLRSWHKTAGKNQVENGKRFELSYEDFLELWGDERLAKMDRWMEKGSAHLYMRLNANSDLAWVLSWTSNAESQGDVMHKGNAQICTRIESFKACRLGKGDTHSAKSREKMSRSHTGSTKPEKVKAKIASSMLGVHVGRVGTAEEAARKSAAQKARWDRYRAEKAAAKAKRGDA